MIINFKTLLNIVNNYKKQRLNILSILPVKKETDKSGSYDTLYCKDNIYGFDVDLSISYNDYSSLIINNYISNNYCNIYCYSDFSLSDRYDFDKYFHYLKTLYVDKLLNLIIKNNKLNLFNRIKYYFFNKKLKIKINDYYNGHYIKIYDDYNVLIINFNMYEFELILNNNYKLYNYTDLNIINEVIQKTFFK